MAKKGQDNRNIIVLDVESWKSKLTAAKDSWETLNEVLWVETKTEYNKKQRHHSLF